MIISYKISSAKRFLKEEQMEVVDVMSEGSSLSGYKSKAYIFLKKLETQIKTILLARFKDVNYEILFVADEDYKKYTPIRTVVLLDSPEMIKYAKEKIKNGYLEFGVLKKTPENIKTTFFKSTIQCWCNEIQNYLVNKYNFQGNTKIQASICDKKLCSFKVSASGKGMNDKISSTLKRISVLGTNGKIDINAKDKFTIIDSFFEKLN